MTTQLLELVILLWMCLIHDVYLSYLLDNVAFKRKERQRACVMFGDSY